MNKQMQTFSFSPPINLVKEDKWLLGVSSFQTINSVLITNDENNSFSITIPGQWNSKSVEKTIDEPNKLLKLRSPNDNNLHVEQVREKMIIL